MRSKRWSIAIATGLMVALIALPAWSQSRDADGTRMQARHVEVGTTHSESLSPPEDRADWRMIRIGESTDLALSLTLRGSDVEATLTLTSATGDRLEQKTAGKDGASITRTLDAGIYYIAVESSDALRYTLSIK